MLALLNGNNARRQDAANFVGAGFMALIWIELVGVDGCKFLIAMRACSHKFCLIYGEAVTGTIGQDLNGDHDGLIPSALSSSAISLATRSQAAQSQWENSPYLCIG